MMLLQMAKRQSNKISSHERRHKMTQSIDNNKETPKGKRFQVSVQIPRITENNPGFDLPFEVYAETRDGAVKEARTQLLNIIAPEYLWCRSEPSDDAVTFQVTEAVTDTI